MKYLAIAVIFILLCALSLPAQTPIENKTSEPVPLLRSSGFYPGCGERQTSIINEALKAEPKNEYLYLERAKCLKETKNPDFLKDVLTILNLNPKLDNYLYNNLNSLILSGELKEKQANFKYLASATPNHWYVSAVSARIKTAQNDYRGAIDDWLKVMASTPHLDGYNFTELTSVIEYSATDKVVLEFYERVFSVAQKMHQELSAKLKELPSDSPEYKEVRSNFDQFGKYLRSISYTWAYRAAKLGNTQIESAVLEKMVQIEPRWLGYDTRSSYYRQNKNTQKALEDEFISVELHIASRLEEIKQTGAQDKQAAINQQFCGLYRRLGELYFQREQFVKALDKYEKAKTFCGENVFLESSINAALRKLNPTEKQPK